jgi:predicted transcriptional regulator
VRELQLETFDRWICRPALHYEVDRFKDYSPIKKVKQHVLEIGHIFTSAVASGSKTQIRPSVANRKVASIFLTSATRKTGDKY